MRGAKPMPLERRRLLGPTHHKAKPGYWRCMAALEKAYEMPAEEEKQEPPRKPGPIDLEKW
jgi:hypothetical protein